MVLHFYSDTSVATTLSGSITNSQTTLQVPESASDNGWPTSFPFTLALDYGAAGMELVDVTAKGVVGGVIPNQQRTWSITRGINATTAVAHSSGATVQHVGTARDLHDDALGVIAYNTLTAATSGGTTTELIAVTCTATLDVSRQYKIKTTPFHPQSTVAGDFVNVFLRQSTAGGSVSISSTQIGQAICTCPTANGIRDTKAIETLLVAPTTGTYQFGITFIRISPATGTVTLNQAPTSRVLALMVEDCGPALAAVSP